MGLIDDIQQSFGSENLYDVFGVPKTADADSIKKAYRRKSLLCHPDKAGQEDRDEFTRKFQLLSKCYEILRDPEKRKIYDETGEVDDDSLNSTTSDWQGYWRRMFPKVTATQITDFMNRYIGSDTEREDLKHIYEKCKGDMNKISEYHIGYTIEEEDRLRSIIHELIEAGDVPNYTAFSKETAASKRKRRQRYTREAQELEEMQKSYGDLALLIHQNEQRRSAESESFLASLEAKYASKPKKKSVGTKRKRQD